MQQLSLISAPINTIKQWAIVAGVVAVLCLMGAALWKWNSFTTGLYDKGFKAGVASVSREEVSKLKAANEVLEMEKRAVEAQQKELNEAASKTQTDYLTLQDRARVLSRKLDDSKRMQREADAAFAKTLASASAEGCRAYAKDTGDNFRRSTGHVRRFGEEAISCAATAHAAVKASPQTVTGLPPEPSLPAEPELPR